MAGYSIAFTVPANSELDTPEFNFYTGEVGKTEYYTGKPYPIIFNNPLTYAWSHVWGCSDSSEELASMTFEFNNAWNGTKLVGRLEEPFSSKTIDGKTVYYSLGRMNASYATWYIPDVSIDYRTLSEGSLFWYIQYGLLADESVSVPIPVKYKNLETSFDITVL